MRRTPSPETASTAGGRLRAGRRGSTSAVRGSACRSAQPAKASFHGAIVMLVTRIVEVRRVARDGSPLHLPPPFDVDHSAGARTVVGREYRWSKQSKAARWRQWTKRGADLLREDHSWSERHGSEQQMSATCFAAPSFFVAEPALPAGDGPCAREVRGVGEGNRVQKPSA